MCLKGFLNTLNLRGGRQFYLIRVFNLILFRLYGVMYRGFTRSEAVGLVCKLLRQAFNGRLFWTRCPVFSTAALPGDI